MSALVIAALALVPIAALLPLRGRLARWLGQRAARLPMIFQSEAAECSLACVAMVAGYHGHHLSLTDLRKLYPASLRGLSVRSLMRAATLVGLRARALRCDVDQLRDVALPALLHWNADHFVVLRAVRGTRAVIHDPATGIGVLTRAELSQHFSGIVVELQPAPDFRPRAGATRLGVPDLIGKMGDLKWALAQIVALSGLLELLTLLPIMLTRVVVDVGLANHDQRFILQLAGVLVAAALVRALTGFLRDRHVVDTAAAVNLRMAQRLFRYTLSLPLGFFEKRPIGMLIERYHVIDEIERFFASSLPLALLDGLTAIVSIVLVFWMSAALGALALATVLLHFLVRSVGHESRRAHEARVIWAKGTEHGHVIETLRTIFTSKAAAIEHNRYNVWLGLYGKLVGAQRALGSVDAGYRGVTNGLAAANAALFLLLGGLAVVDGHMTVGTLLAAMVYNAQFVARALQLGDRIHEYRLLAVRLELLEDIVRTEPEEGALLLAAESQQQQHRVDHTLGGAIAVEGISFRYGADQPLILEDVSFAVRPGELVAIVGHNGAGKTTLLKLLLGLYPPASGRILFDGHDLETLLLSPLREQIGLVTQDDQLLTGTIAQNIALFDPELSMARVQAAAQLACVHDDIEAMPMKYTTGVGELGSPFSEGQRQKVLLARALYRQPAIVMMDEGTANLDGASEAVVLDNLARLPATKLLIAHRPATIERADRILMINDGVVSEMTRTAALRALADASDVTEPARTPLAQAGT